MSSRSASEAIAPTRAVYSFIGFVMTIWNSVANLRTICYTENETHQLEQKIRYESLAISSNKWTMFINNWWICTEH